MFPKTKRQAFEHRKNKRQLEIGGILQHLNDRPDVRIAGHRSRILEFGSGDGFQIPFLRRLGDVVATDIRTAKGIHAVPELRYAECSVAQPPFPAGSFDLIFSNHVIEHVTDLPRAFRELQRIGSRDCLYAFSVPTNTWLLLSLPAQYFKKLQHLVGMLRGRVSYARLYRDKVRHSPDGRPVKESALGKILRFLLPEGHGVEFRFTECFRRFRASSWENLFSRGGFVVVDRQPLLLYGPSEWPVVPTRGRMGVFYSSILFILKKEV